MSDYNAEEDKNNLKHSIIFFSFWVFLVSLIGGWGAWLYALAFVLTFGIPIVGVFFIIRSKSSGDRENQAVNNEIEAMANDASFDISEQIIIWDKLLFSKGVGTQLEGRDEVISDMQRRLVNVRDEITNASSPRHLLEAVLAADSLLVSARAMI